MKTLLPLLPITLLLALTACGEPFSNAPFEADVDYLTAAPSAAQIRLGGPGLSFASTGFIVAEPAELYVFTRKTMALLNGAAFDALHDVDALVRSAPTTRETGLRVWQPEAHPLDPLDHLFEMRHTEEGFDYALKQRRHGDEGPRLLTLFGHAVPATADAPASGELTLDLDATAALTGGALRGTLHVSYVFEGDHTSLAMVFEHFSWGEDPFDAVYRFEGEADGSGQFDFGGPGDDGGWVDIRSRWTVDGEGRADVRFSEGGESAHLGECWDTNFVSVWGKLGFQEEGRREACAFAEASYPESTQISE